MKKLIMLIKVKASKIVILLLIAIFLTNCYYNPNKIAAQAKMKHKIYKTSKFMLTTYYKFDNNKFKAPIIVYIEGDGKAWVSRYKLSSNPTPKKPLTLQLASMDNNPNVIYIARPCQFTTLSLDNNCNSKYWSQARYAAEVVDSINDVIDQFKNFIKYNQKIHLVGYSGGATIAGIIAAKRNDITSLRTIAGNLDHDMVSNFHGTTKLYESLNLADFIENISTIPQMHYIGKKDQIIPVDLVQNFVRKINTISKNYQCAYYKVFDKLDHYNGWEKIWDQFSSIIPVCQ